MTVTADWSVLDFAGVNDTIRVAAHAVKRQYERADVDDLIQDAQISCALNADRVMGYLEDPQEGHAHLYRWVWSDLTDTARTEARRASRCISLTRLTDE